MDGLKSTLFHKIHDEEVRLLVVSVSVSVSVMIEVNVVVAGLWATWSARGGNKGTEMDDSGAGSLILSKKKFHSTLLHRMAGRGSTNGGVTAIVTVEPGPIGDLISEEWRQGKANDGKCIWIVEPVEKQEFRSIRFHKMLKEELH